MVQPENFEVLIIPAMIAKIPCADDSLNSFMLAIPKNEDVLRCEG